MPSSFSATSPALLYFLSPSSIVDLGDRLLAKARKRPPLPLIAAASRQHIEDTFNERRRAGAPMNEALGGLLSLWGVTGAGNAKSSNAKTGDAEAGDAKAGDDGSAGSGRSLGSGRVATFASESPTV